MDSGLIFAEHPRPFPIQAQVQTPHPNPDIVWQNHLVSQDTRTKLLKQKSFVLWLTGLSGAGKTTLASAIEQELAQRAHLTYVLDGDNLRHGLCSDLGFSPEDRNENIRRAGEVARLMADAGLIVLAGFISPFEQGRDQVRTIVSPTPFIEIYCKCSPEVRMQRDPKGLYEKASKGKLAQFLEQEQFYEAPRRPEILLETDRIDIHQCVEIVLAYLTRQNLISPAV